MKLWIVRHGKAEPGSASGMDAARELTALGVQQAQFVAQAIAAHPRARPHRVLTSPAARTRATAEALARSLGLLEEIEPHLACDLPLSQALEAIRSRPEACLAIVGHNPTLARLIGLLAVGPASPAIDLRTGEAYLLEAVVDLGPGGWAEPGSWRAMERIRLGD